jgi:hypothetical protein
MQARNMSKEHGVGVAPKESEGPNPNVLMAGGVLIAVLGMFRFDMGAPVTPEQIVIWIAGMTVLLWGVVSKDGESS